MWRLGVFSFVILFFLSACMLSPTTVSDSDVSLLERSYRFEKDNRPIKISSDTIVLDVRAFFDYQISRLPGALHVDARDFSLRKVRGDDLQERAIKIARRLALYGINPFSHVVVVGYGERGDGAEGVVALTLLALGVERVQIGSMKDFRFLVTNKNSNERANQRYWEPRVVGSLICPAHSSEDATFIIDLSKKAPMTLVPGWQKIAIIYKNWKDFLKKEDFSPNYKMKSDLAKEKIEESARVMVRGPQAPIVVFSMLQMGFTRVCMMDE
jgi:rhodanese-related sulfurtransferase